MFGVLLLGPWDARFRAGSVANENLERDMRSASSWRRIRADHLDGRRRGRRLTAGVRWPACARLADLTTLRLGGPPRRSSRPRDEAAVVAAVRAADAAGEPLLILAGGSNLVVADAGFPGTVLRIASRGVREDGDRLDGRGGRAVGPVRRALRGRRAAPGVECLVRHPGLRRRDADPERRRLRPGGRRRDRLRARARPRGRARSRSSRAAACGFAYRSSAFKRDAGPLGRARGRRSRCRAGRARAPIRYAELARALGVAEGETAPLADVREAVLALRRGKGMVVDPGDPDSVSAGSFFTNPVLDPDAFAALEARARPAGRGARVPRFPQPDGTRQDLGRVADRARRASRAATATRATVAISSKHTLALTNRGAGTTAQLVALAREIADGRASEAFGVELEPEPVFVGHAWRLTRRRRPVPARPRSDSPEGLKRSSSSAKQNDPCPDLPATRQPGAAVSSSLSPPTSTCGSGSTALALGVASAVQLLGYTPAELVGRARARARPPR